MCEQKSYTMVQKNTVCTVTLSQLCSCFERLDILFLMTNPASISLCGTSSFPNQFQIIGIHILTGTDGAGMSDNSGRG